jgi:hypothetical protein
MRVSFFLSARAACSPLSLSCVFFPVLCALAAVSLLHPDSAWPQAPWLVAPSPRVGPSLIWSSALCVRGSPLPSFFLCRASSLCPARTPLVPMAAGLLCLWFRPQLGARSSVPAARPAPSLVRARSSLLRSAIGHLCHGASFPSVELPALQPFPNSSLLAELPLPTSHGARPYLLGLRLRLVGAPPCAQPCSRGHLLLHPARFLLYVHARAKLPARRGSIPSSRACSASPSTRRALLVLCSTMEVSVPSSSARTPSCSLHASSSGAESFFSLPRRPASCLLCSPASATRWCSNSSAVVVQSALARDYGRVRRVRQRSVANSNVVTVVCFAACSPSVFGCTSALVLTVGSR